MSPKTTKKQHFCPSKDPPRAPSVAIKSEDGVSPVYLTTPKGYKKVTVHTVTKGWTQLYFKKSPKAQGGTRLSPEVKQARRRRRIQRYLIRQASKARFPQKFRNKSVPPTDAHTAPYLKKLFARAEKGWQGNHKPSVDLALKTPRSQPLKQVHKHKKRAALDNAAFV